MQDLVLSLDDISTISKLFEQEPEVSENSYTWTFKDNNNNESIYFTIHTEVKGIDKKIVIVSVQTIYGYYELHDIHRWEVLSPDEVFFFSEDKNTISCLSVSKNSGVSIFSNLSKSILANDITTLDSALLLSTLQLSIFDSKNI